MSGVGSVGSLVPEVAHVGPTVQLCPVVRAGTSKHFFFFLTIFNYLHC